MLGYYRGLAARDSPSGGELAHQGLDGVTSVTCFLWPLCRDGSTGGFSLDEVVPLHNLVAVAGNAKGAAIGLAIRRS